MPNYTSRSQRNHRNNPYAFDDVAVRVHRSTAGVAWRWRTELATLTTGTIATAALAHAVTLTWAGIILGSAAPPPTSTPPAAPATTSR